jgi:hypothetical protein
MVAIVERAVVIVTTRELHHQDGEIVPNLVAANPRTMSVAHTMESIMPP